MSGLLLGLHPKFPKWTMSLPCLWDSLGTFEMPQIASLLHFTTSIYKKNHESQNTTTLKSQKKGPAPGCPSAPPHRDPKRRQADPCLCWSGYKQPEGHGLPMVAMGWIPQNWLSNEEKMEKYGKIMGKHRKMNI